MLRILPIAALVAGMMFAAPTFAEELTQDQIDAAQAVIDDADLSDDAYKLLWCGGAFGIVQAMLTQQGKTDDAKKVTDLMNVIYTKAVKEINDPDMSQDDMTKLASQFVIIAKSETGDEAEYSQEDCTALAQP
jgi:hypothetical protein